MSLPVPNLDDRRFQDLVDDAKRLVQERRTEWTDHNVSDPGVTLIEVFAWMTDQLLYRLNRVPDRNYVKFLELIGVRLFPPTAARTDVTFWLSAPQPDVVRIPEDTEVATVRTQTEQAIVFSTMGDLAIIPTELLRIESSVAAGRFRDHTDTVSMGVPIACFDAVPKPDDILYVGLSRAAPSCSIELHFQCPVAGHGIDPKDPPLAWEAWDGKQWARCEVDSDTTGGFNRDGDVILHLPPTHAELVLDRTSAGWIRARVVQRFPEQQMYTASPQISGATVATIGGTVTAVHAERTLNEVVGTAEGVPGSRFPLKNRPVVPSAADLTVEVDRSLPDGSSDVMIWNRVETFANSGPDDLHFVLDPISGELQFGPAVREQGGGLRRYGAVPPKGTIIRVPVYRTGGGRRGNVAKHTLSVLKSSIPFVERVDNRRPADGGVDGEDVESAKIRGPILLRTRDRAVTAEDYEQIAREAAPEVARVRCVAAGDGADPGAVRVLIVPSVAHDQGRLDFLQLKPTNDTLERITARLDEARIIGVNVMVEPPAYHMVTVVATLRARPRTNTARLTQDALEALYRYLDPIVGGPSGQGWPFGRPVQSGEIYAALQRLRGTELVEDVKLAEADPQTLTLGAATDRVEVERNALVFPYRHQVRVEPSS